MPKKLPVSSPKGYVDKFMNGEHQQSRISEYDIESAKISFGLPEGYTVRAAAEGELPNSIHSPNDLCIYHDQIKLGLTFPLLNILGAILNFTQFNLAMLTPNFIGLIITLYKFCQKYNVAWVPENLFYLFTLKPALCHVAFRARHKSFTTYGYESSIHEWKFKYFFIHSPNGWPFLTTPGNASEVALCMPSCPAALQQWFNEFPMKVYTLDFRHCDVMTVEEGQKLKGKKVKRNEGDGAEKVPLAKKVKLTRITKGQIRRKLCVSKPVLRISSPEEDSSSDKSHSASGSGSSSYSEGYSNEEVDIITEDPVINIPSSSPPRGPKVGQTSGSTPPAIFRGPPTGQTSDSIPAGGGTKAPADESFYFVNENDQLVLKRNSDIPLAQHPFNRFGPLVGEFLQSTTENENLKTLNLDELEMLYHSYSISAMRAGGYLCRLAKEYNSTLTEAGPHYTRLINACEAGDKRITELEGQVRSLTEDLKSYDDVLAATAEKDKILEAENTALKASVEKLLAENAEQKKQIETMASSSRELTVEEQIEKISETEGYARWMIDLLSQGFEKFRRAAFRRFRDPEVLTTIKEIDIVVADQEEEISDSDEDDDAAAAS